MRLAQARKTRQTSLIRFFFFVQAKGLVLNIGVWFLVRTVQVTLQFDLHRVI